jgi:hypothetical protein
VGEVRGRGQGGCAGWLCVAVPLACAWLFQTVVVAAPLTFCAAPPACFPLHTYKPSCLPLPAAELRHPLCLVLLRNCASPYDQAVTAAVRLFEAILSAQVSSSQAVRAGRAAAWLRQGGWRKRCCRSSEL